MQNHAASQAGEQGPHINLPTTYSLEYICRDKETQGLPDIRDSQLSKTEPTEQSKTAQHGGYGHSVWG